MNFLEVVALKVTQPLGEFYITKFKARDLLKFSFSEELTYVDDKGNLKGTQRKQDNRRLREIAKYIESVEMSFPNSIILAVNYDSKEGQVIEDQVLTWKLQGFENDVYRILIPTSAKLAAIIDGQHRLNAFRYVEDQDRLELEIPCSIFFDLPNSYQAFLFATINGNQKRVDRSLALEQFGFNVADEPQKSWTPEKLAVYFSRKLNLSKPKSPFYQHIKVAPRGEEILFKRMEFSDEDWYISTATIVDGILSLITSNPKRDRVEMATEHIFKGRNRDMVQDVRDKSPLRNLYLENRDDELYKIITSFFEIVAIKLWQDTEEKSYILKTVGISALFDLLKRILQENVNERSFDKYINPLAHVDFSDNFFQASGVGRSRLKNLMFYANDFNHKYNEDNIDDMKRLLKSE
jgi:DNA phosphorothioation-associated DGQHR protein 1